ncbi:MAG: hypothetical protein ACKVOR_04110 [Flavobacteriales bacterium]
MAGAAPRHFAWFYYTAEKWKPAIPHPPVAKAQPPPAKPQPPASKPQPPAFSLHLGAARAGAWVDMNSPCAGDWAAMVRALAMRKE